jgi:hypothetical protein
MKTKRPKYKVRRQRGRNAIRRMWKRTERSKKKWKIKKTGRRVRKSRKVKRLTATNTRSNGGRRGGSETPKKAKQKRWLKKKRRGQKGMARRYGGGRTVTGKRVAVKVRKAREKKKYGRKRRKSSLLMMCKEVAVEGPQGLEKVSKDGRRRNVGREHALWPIDRRVEMRRWRAGRVETMGTGRKRRARGAVTRVGTGQGGAVVTDGHRLLKAGEGRQVTSEAWKERKYVINGRQYGKGRRSLVWKRNGRAAREYARVDYRTGTRRVKRRPETKEVRRPGRRERSRWIIRGA